MALDLSVLNETQKEAVLDTEGYVLVLAGAGSGKTRVLTYRVAHLVDSGISPYCILAITFTNKATAEMKIRLTTLLGEENGVWISTFHSLCATVLRKEADKIGYQKNFSIYDESDSSRVLKKVLREKHLEDSPMKDRFALFIGDAKNRGITPKELLTDISGIEENAELIVEVFERYEELLKLANAMDFDDLLYKTKTLFTECPDVLRRYQMRFRYIHVDEFQDTNGVQYELVKMLSKQWGNLFVVGDDDQSIYGWRGAVVENILNFDKEFPEAKIHKLLRNYRSTSSILDAANNVIRNNQSRHRKELFTECGKGVRVEYCNAYNDRQEAEHVVEQIISLKRFHGYKNSDFAILVRANSLTRNFESLLNGSRVQYRVLGGFKFFDRKEVQDVIAYLRMVSNTHDSEAIERIINFPARGIGDTTVEKLSTYARQNMVDLFDVILESGAGALSGSAQKKVEEFKQLVSDLVSNKTLSLTEYVHYLIERVGFREAYEKSGKEEDEVRYENIMEFERHVKDFARTHEGATVESFLETVRLAPEREEEIYDGEMVTLATMHAVKGLEFKVVFLVGCEEGIFPTARAVKESADSIEEERRIMYVAITRARERLYISCCGRRFRFNKIENMLPSRFIAEAKGGEQEEPYRVFSERRRQLDGISRQTMGRDGEREIVTPAKFGREAFAQTPAKPVARNSDTAGYVSGAKVLHPTYGEGTIIMVAGTGAEKVATVAFPKLGVKKFALAMANLKLL